MRSWVFLGLAFAVTAGTAYGQEASDISLAESTAESPEDATIEGSTNAVQYEGSATGRGFIFNSQPSCNGVMPLRLDLSFSGTSDDSEHLVLNTHVVHNFGPKCFSHSSSHVYNHPDSMIRMSEDTFVHQFGEGSDKSLVQIVVTGVPGTEILGIEYRETYHHRLSTGHTHSGTVIAFGILKGVSASN